MRIIIPSYNRPDKVITKSIFPDAEVVVPESQKEDYLRKYKNVVSIPDERDGSVGRKRNTILDLFKGEDIFMVDDDIRHFATARGGEITGDILVHIIENAFVMAREIGAGMWGFHYNLDRSVEYFPFSLTKQVYYAVGILPDLIRYDESLTAGEDVDFWLKKLNKYRKVLRFNMYAPVPSSSKVGGITDTQREKELVSNKILARRWGSKIITIKDDGGIGVHSPIKGV